MTLAPTPHDTPSGETSRHLLCLSGSSTHKSWRRNRRGKRRPLLLRYPAAGNGNMPRQGIPCRPHVPCQRPIRPATQHQAERHAPKHSLSHVGQRQKMMAAQLGLTRARTRRSATATGCGPLQSGVEQQEGERVWLHTRQRAASKSSRAARSGTSALVWSRRGRAWQTWLEVVSVPCWNLRHGFDSRRTGLE